MRRYRGATRPRAPVQPVRTNLVIACVCGSGSAASEWSRSDCFHAWRCRAAAEQPPPEVDSLIGVKLKLSTASAAIHRISPSGGLQLPAHCSSSGTPRKTRRSTRLRVWADAADTSVKSWCAVKTDIACHPSLCAPTTACMARLSWPRWFKRLLLFLVFVISLFFTDLEG
jgi:hypothetical protein